MHIIDEQINFLADTKLREKIEKVGFLKSFGEDDVILREDSYISAIPIVMRGSIKVLRMDEKGHELLLYYLRPGESCIMSFLGGIHHETSKIKAVAEEESEILFIPIDKVGMLMRDHSEWIDYIFRLYHKRFEESLEVVNAIAFKKMDERLLNLLKKKSEFAGTNTLTVTYENIANELGTARVVVSRLLKQMEEMNLVELGRNKITLM